MKKLVLLAVLAMTLCGCNTIATRCKFWGVGDIRGSATGGPIYPDVVLLCQGAFADMADNRGPWTQTVMPTGRREPVFMDYMWSGCMILELPIAAALDTVLIVPDYIYSVRCWF